MQADLKVGDRFDGVFVSGMRPLVEKLVAERRDVVIDVSETAGVDAEALSLLTYMHKRLASHGHKVRVVGASDELIRFFENFHLAGLFIEEELTAAPYWRS